MQFSSPSEHEMGTTDMTEHQQQIADRVALVEALRGDLAEAHDQGDDARVGILRRRMMAAIADLQRVRGY